MAVSHSRSLTSTEEEDEENECNHTISLDRNQKVLIIYHFGHNEEDVDDPSHRMNVIKYAAI